MEDHARMTGGALAVTRVPGTRHEGRLLDFMEQIVDNPCVYRIFFSTVNQNGNAEFSGEDFGRE